MATAFITVEKRWVAPAASPVGTSAARVSRLAIADNAPDIAAREPLRIEQRIAQTDIELRLYPDELTDLVRILDNPPEAPTDGLRRTLQRTR